MIPTRVPRADVLDPLAPAQARYAAGTREILENYFAGTPIRDEYLIVHGGALAGTGARSYTATS
jgi:formate dehydrogenase